MPCGSGVFAAFTTKIPTATVTELTYFKSLALICLDKDNTASMQRDQDSILWLVFSNLTSKAMFTDFWWSKTKRALAHLALWTLDKLLTFRNGSTGHKCSHADVKKKRPRIEQRTSTSGGLTVQLCRTSTTMWVHGRLVRMETFGSVEVWEVIRGGRRLRGRAEAGHLCLRFCSSEPQTSGRKSFAVSEHVIEL